jgi:cell division protease FtsH
LIFLRRDIGEQLDYSEHVCEMITEEIRTVLEQPQARAQAIVSEHRSAADRLATELLARETLMRRRPS